MTSPLFKSPIPLNYLDTDTSLTANSDVKVPTQKAVKAYADTKAPALGADDNYVTDAEKTKLSNLSGTNTGDQTLPVKNTGAEITTGTDDAKFVTAKSLADATVGKLGSAWTSYDPTLANLTIGNGTKTFAYARIGKIIHVRGKIVFGSTTSVSGAIGLTVPVTAHANVVGQSFLGVRLLDSGTNSFNGIGYHSTTSYVDLFAVSAGSTYAGWAGTSSTVPFTWANTDEIHVNFTYEAE